jgi:hypothetical protein
MNPYTVHDYSHSVSQMRQEFSAVLKNKGLTEEDISHLDVVLGIDNVILLCHLTEHDLFPGNTPASDVDLSFLGGKKRCQLLRLVYLAQEFRKAEYSWLTDAEKYQLFLRGEVNFITMGKQETLEKLMRDVEHRATRWLATHISRAELAEWEQEL